MTHFLLVVTDIKLNVQFALQAYRILPSYSNIRANRTKTLLLTDICMLFLLCPFCLFI